MFDIDKSPLTRRTRGPSAEPSQNNALSEISLLWSYEHCDIT